MASSSADCSRFQQQFLGCPSVVNDGSSIDVSDTRTSDSGDAGSSGSSPGDSRASNEPECPENRIASCYRAVTPGDGFPDVSITDLARFAPTGVAVQVEPFGAAVRGLPSNFVAASEVHVVNGTLFDHDVRVRFTPDRHRFDYGDGTVRTIAEAGTTWASSGSPQFTPTATSHVYAERGTVTARVDVLYAAEIDFGRGWFTVPGHVTAPGQPVPVRVWEARTALVAHTCDDNPAAAGC